MKMLSNNERIYFATMPKILGWRFILLLSVLFLPFSVFASTIYIDTSHSDIFVGDTILFSVRIDSEGKNINAVDGEVFLDYAADAVSLVDINTSGSKFSLWPSRPIPSELNRRVSFAGGFPGGFASKDGIIFNLVLKLHKTGPISLSPNNIGVYLHDGQGTKDMVNIKDLVIDVLPEKSDLSSVDDWRDLISSDKTPPESFEIDLGNDSSIFDNQYFISFFTTDQESGIAYYEVKEGEKDFVRTESPYLLQDQSLKNLIKVKAIDKAGNERVEELMPLVPTVPSNYKNTLFLIVILIIIAVIFYVFWRRFRRKIK